MIPLSQCLICLSTHRANYISLACGHLLCLMCCSTLRIKDSQKDRKGQQMRSGLLSSFGRQAMSVEGDGLDMGQNILTVNQRGSISYRCQQCMLATMFEEETEETIRELREQQFEQPQRRQIDTVIQPVQIQNGINNNSNSNNNQTNDKKTYDKQVYRNDRNDRNNRNDKNDRNNKQVKHSYQSDKYGHRQSNGVIQNCPTNNNNPSTLFNPNNKPLDTYPNNSPHSSFIQRISSSSVVAAGSQIGYYDEGVGQKESRQIGKGNKGQLGSRGNNKNYTTDLRNQTNPPLLESQKPNNNLLPYHNSLIDQAMNIIEAARLTNQHANQYNTNNQESILPLIDQIRALFRLQSQRLMIIQEEMIRRAKDLWMEGKVTKERGKGDILAVVSQGREIRGKHNTHSSLHQPIPTHNQPHNLVHSQPQFIHHNPSNIYVSHPNTNNNKNITVSSSSSLNELPLFTHDKLLSKLEHNEIKMKEKLSRYGK